MLHNRAESVRLPVENEQTSVGIKPKVLIMIATDPIGGPGKGLFQFLRHFPREAGDYLLCNFYLKNRPIGQFVAEAQRTGLKLILLNQRARIDPGLILQAGRIVREHGINLVQTHGYKTHLIGLFLRLIWGTPWIAFAHGYIQGGWKVRLYNWLDRAVLRYADRIVTVSESMTSLLVRHDVRPDKIRLVYNAIESDGAESPTGAAGVRERHGVPARDRVVGVIGRLSPEKGQLVFLNALRIARRSCPDVTALLIGEGEDQALLERYCRDHELASRVVFTGYRENVAEYFQALDLLVLPSMSEGLPNVVLEAMSFGVPVLATRVGGVPEIIGNDNGVMVPAGDAEALAKNMVELLQNDSLRASIGAEGRRSLHPRFSPEHRARQILAVYRELLDGQAGQPAASSNG